MRSEDCTRCKLHLTCNTVGLMGVGPKQADVMIIGEAPGKQEDLGGEPFIGKAGQLLTGILEECGFDRDEVYITNAVHCRPPDNRSPSKSEIKHCRHWLGVEIARVRPKFVLLLGNTPLMAITDKAGITQRRGRPFEQDGIIYVPTFHPAFALRDPTQETFIRQDVELLAQIVKAGEIPREDNLNPILVTTMAKFEEMLGSLRGRISFDIETTCLYPWQQYELKTVKGKPTKIDAPAKITMIGFGTRDGEYSIPTSMFNDETLDLMIHRIDEALEENDVELVMHNGKFDCLWVMVHYGVHWYKRLVFDTMLAHYILDENSRHGLKELAMKYCGAPDWDIDRDEKRGNTTPQKLGMYHAHDLYYTLQLSRVFMKMLRKDTEVKRVFDKVLMPCARMFTEIEYHGLYIDHTKFDEAEEVLRKMKAEAEEELKQFGNINWGSPAQLSKLLYEDLKIKPMAFTKTGAPSCSESALNQIDHPCVGALIRYRGAKQQLSFFIEGWKPFLHWRRINGEQQAYLHPSFKLHGTVTGRLSCEHPNLQQVPRDPRIRTLITAPPGWTLIECDLSQIELRVAAELANERTMLYAFAHDIDVHWLTAIREIERGAGLKDLVLDTARTWKQDKSLTYSEAIEVLLEMGPDAAAEINPVWKEFRKKAKAINFGYLYGMWWKKFKLYARDNYGVEVTDDQAQESRIAFFDNYSDFPNWHTRQRNYARRNGYVKSLAGRKRRLPNAQLNEDTPSRREAERQAINSPVQSFANEINLMAALQLHDEFGTDVVRICGTVHDAILARVRTERVPEVMHRLLQIMTRPKLFSDFDIELKVPVLADGKVGPWGAGISLEKWEKLNASG